MYRQHYPDDPGMHNMDHRDRYTRTSYRRNPTFCERVKQSLVAVIAGILLICASIGLLFWNEGRAVQTAQSLAEGLAAVRSLQTVEVAFDQNNGHLVHLVGPLKTIEALYDSQYKVGVNAVKLKREVQMYQWVEQETTRETKEGDETRTETEYSYNEEWHSELVDSDRFFSKFSHENPREMPVKSELYTAEHSQIGNFLLSENLVGKITNFKRLEVHEGPPDALLHNGGLYHGKDPSRPQIGDIRVHFEYAGLSGSETSSLGPPDMVSVIARQKGRHLDAYQTEAGDKLEILYMGEYSAEKIFGNEQAQNSMMTWAMRFAGWLVMFIGFGCLTKIVVTLVDWIPLVRDLVSLGVTMMNATLAISLSLTVIALGWIRYRPWLGCTILAIAFVPMIVNRFFRRSHSRPSPRYNHPFVD